VQAEVELQAKATNLVGDTCLCRPTPELDVLGAQGYLDNGACLASREPSTLTQACHAYTGTECLTYWSVVANCLKVLLPKTMDLLPNACSPKPIATTGSRVKI